nr:MAG TPA: hypothetical protein [Caudoviricetes sp.]
MNAEGIRQIARMQSEIDAYSIGLKYILIQLKSDNRMLFPELDVPEISWILDEIAKLQEKVNQ